MTGITVLGFYDRISTFHTYKPFFTCPGAAHGYRFTFTSSPEYCLTKDTNRVLILVRMFLKPDEVDWRLLEQLRDKYDRIAFFNGHPGAGLHHSGVLPYVDLYFNKGLWRDRSLYLQRHYGDELYTEYYHREFGVEDAPEETSPSVSDPAQLEKLRLGWNVGIGDFPRPKFGQRVGVYLARKAGLRWSRLFARHRAAPRTTNTGAIDVHARLGFQKRPTRAAQRRIMLEKIQSHPSFLVGPKIAQWEYNREVRNSKLVFSPFALGELCFRDFEAVHSGALLVKPDMSHMETWPDIFRPGETYAPVKWDGSNLVSVCEYYLENQQERVTMVDRAKQVYLQQTAGMCRRFSATMREIIG